MSLKNPFTKLVTFSPLIIVRYKMYNTMIPTMEDIAIPARVFTKKSSSETATKTYKMI